MITQVKDFIDGIISEVRSTPYVSEKIASSEWLTGAPFYFYGTPIEVNNRLMHQPNGQKKFPAIFLFEPFNVNENEDFMVNIGASPSISLFFLNDWSGMERWNTEDHYTHIINDMETLKREFIKKLKSNKYVLEVTSYDTTRHAKWGLFINNKGNKTPVFNEKLSGIELSITFDIDKLIDGCNLFE